MSDQREARLQIATANYLKGIIRNGKTVINVQAPFPGLLWTHVSNEQKDAKEAFWGQIKGVRAGTPDILAWERINGVSASLAIELKVKGRPQRPNQKEFQRRFAEKGGLYAVCETVKAVRDQLIVWGLKCYNMNCVEPRLSNEELLAIQAELYKR